ncbi:MAG: phosphoglycerate dehydrogenase [Scrofimicrobium sp.]
MTNVLLLENPHRIASEILESAGLNVRVVKGGLDENELIDALEGVQILGIRSKTEVTTKVLAHSPSLEVVGAFCIGTNQIALGTAAERGIPVFNAPYANTRSVVELAVGEIIALTRRLTVKNSMLHRGRWDKTAANAHEVRGRTLGILGYGNIGTQLSVLAEAMGMRVLFYDIEEKLALGNAEKAASMADMLSRSDVVSIHVNGNPSNKNLIGSEELALMKPGSVLVNLSRGFVVDQVALKDALDSGHLIGAAVDVFPEEPKESGDPFDSELQGMDNVILTPHIGGSTIEAQHDIGAFVAQKLIDYMALGNTSMAVNVPNLALPVTPSSAARLTFMHHNIPGVMAQLNEALASTHINVEGQGLATMGSLGYAITDVSTPLPPSVMERLKLSNANVSARCLNLQM